MITDADRDEANAAAFNYRPVNKRVDVAHRDGYLAGLSAERARGAVDCSNCQRQESLADTLEQERDEARRQLAQADSQLSECVDILEFATEAKLFSGVWDYWCRDIIGAIKRLHKKDS